MIKGVTYVHFGPFWYHSKPSDIPYSPNQFLGWAVSYSKPALLYKSFKCNFKKTLAPLCVGGTFWNYVYDKDRYNFTQETFVNESERDIRTFVQFVVNATRDYVNLHLKIRSVIMGKLEKLRPILQPTDAPINFFFDLT